MRTKPQEAPVTQENQTDALIADIFKELRRRGGKMITTEQEGTTTTEIDLQDKEVLIIRDDISKRVEVTIRIKEPPYLESTGRMKIDDKLRLFLPATYKDRPPCIILHRLHGDGTFEMIGTNDPSVKIPKGWIMDKRTPDVANRLLLPDLVPGRKDMAAQYVQIIAHGRFVTITREGTADIDEKVLNQLGF